jgi:hypothetical protein
MNGAPFVCLLLLHGRILRTDQMAGQ